MNVLYLHGFIGNPVEYDNWISPKLNYLDISETLHQISLIIYHHNIDHIVAKSIGCYFATMFYNQVDELHLINPCIKPYELLPKHYDYVTDKYVDDLKSLDVIGKSFHYTGSLYVELGDEKIDQKETLQTLTCDDVTIHSDGNHRYTRTQEAFDRIDHRIKYGYSIGEGD